MVTLWWLSLAYRDGILRHQFNKRLESYALCSSQSLFYWRILNKPYSSLVLKMLIKKSAQNENSSQFMNSILWNGKIRVENQTKNRVWEDSSWGPGTSTKIAVQEFHFGPFYFLYNSEHEKEWWRRIHLLVNGQWSSFVYIFRSIYLGPMFPYP